MVFLHIDKKNYNLFEGKPENPIKKMENILNNGKAFILIYMEGCGPCNAVRPEWKNLENVLQKISNIDDIAIIDIDKDIIENVKYIKNPPNSFPTIRYITNKGNTVENYEDSDIKNKDRSIDSFIEWIELKTNKNNNQKKLYKRGRKTKRKNIGKKRKGGKWSLKYKRSINCKNPKGFSQKQFCKYKK
jgi:vacuolar-type H+-ATPase subunit F/Vma7